MPTIDQLNAQDVLTVSDLLAIFSADNGEARKTSLYNLAQFLSAQITVTDSKVTQYSAPTTGAKIVVNGGSSDTVSNSVWLNITPADTIAALTIQFPDAAYCVDRQEILVNCTQIVTVLNWLCTGGTIVGALSTFASANEFIAFRFDIVMQTWYRVG
jgi:hypothetical protein